MEKIDKVRITQIQRFDKDRDGKTLKTKDGRNYTRVRIQIEAYPEKWISGFGNAQNQNWQAGDEAEIIITEKDGYLNFSQPRREDVKLDIMNEKLDRVIIMLEDIADNLAKRP